jgi:pimeloyl-ACP methyl ester carboxylesterase
MRRPREFAWAAAATAALIAVATACGTSPSATPPPSASVESTLSPPVRHEFLTLAGGQAELWCGGAGRPTVVLLSGIGGDHSLLTFGSRLTEAAPACFYDRPGDGPPPPDHPRTAGSDAADLHELLSAAKIPTPVVLVAHSYGGLIAVIAAAKHPEDIAGVLFVDSSVHDQDERFHAILSAAQRRQLDNGKKDFPYVDWPTSLVEAGDSLPSFPDVPVTVITSTHGMTNPCDEQMPCKEMEAVWLQVQTQFAADLPDAHHVLANTGHYIHEDDPDLVLRELSSLLARVDH